MTDRRSNGFFAFLRVIFRGINLVRLAILNVVFFGILALLAFVLSSHLRPVPSDALLVLHPQGELVDQYSVDTAGRIMAQLSGNPVGQVRVRDMIAAIDRAAGDTRIKRILLLPDDLQAQGYAALREVGAALDRFRAAGKKVTVWGNDLDQKQYLLAAHATRILIDPQGGVMPTGLSSYRLYYKDLLDKIGVAVHLFRVGEYKSAAEPYILDHASDAAKRADAFWMGAIWDQWLNQVARLRHLDPQTLRNDVDQLPQRLKNAGGDLAKLSLQTHLVDGLATRHQLVQRLRKQGMPAGRGGEGVRSIDMDDYLAATRPVKMGDADRQVAIVVAQGEISPGRKPPGSIGGDSTSQLLRQVRGDDHVKAVVLRVDSPGGEVHAAEQIRREVVLMRKAGKPVVVSMGDVAASGGYWISMNADSIYAEPNTITGSIGIFGTVFRIPAALDKLGIHSDGIATAPLAGSDDIARPLDPSTATMIQARIDKGYRDFVGGVAKARGQSFQQIDAIAQGRVWTGRQALSRGLVDHLGGLRQAVAAAAHEAKLGKHYRVHYVQPPVSGFQRFMLNFSRSAMARVMLSAGIRLPAWMGQVPHMSADLQLLRSMQSRAPKAYAYCFCTPQS